MRAGEIGAGIQRRLLRCVALLDRLNRPYRLLPVPPAGRFPLGALELNDGIPGAEILFRPLARGPRNSGRALSGRSPWRRPSGRLPDDQVQLLPHGPTQNTSMYPSRTRSPTLLRTLGIFAAGALLVTTGGGCLGVAHLWGAYKAGLIREQVEPLQPGKVLPATPYQLPPGLKARLVEEREASIRAARAAPMCEEATLARGEIDARLCVAHTDGESCGEAIAVLGEVRGDDDFGSIASEELVALYEHLADCKGAHGAVETDHGGWERAVESWERQAPEADLFRTQLARARMEAAAGDREAELRAIQASAAAAGDLLSGPALSQARAELAELAGAAVCRDDTDAPAQGLGSSGVLAGQVWRACGWLALGDVDRAWHALPEARMALSGRAQDSGIPSPDGGCGLPDRPLLRLQKNLINPLARARKGLGPIPTCSADLGGPVGTEGGTDD